MTSCAARAPEFRAEVAFCAACAPAPLYRSEPGTRIAAHFIDVLVLWCRS